MECIQQLGQHVRQCIDLVCCRPVGNTGQGRRRLNARAALREAGKSKARTETVMQLQAHQQAQRAGDMAIQVQAEDSDIAAARKESRWAALALRAGGLVGTSLSVCGRPQLHDQHFRHSLKAATLALL